MSENIKHNCAIVVAHTLHDAYSFGKSLQHRGREAVGLAAIGHDRIDVIKWKGEINRFEVTDLHKIFPGHNYHTYMLHVRYATRGRKDQILQDAHPHTIGGTIEDNGSHIFISDCESAIIHNGQVNERYLKDIDKSKLKTDCDSEGILSFFKKHGEHELLKHIPGAYTLAIADKERKGVIVLRDRTGIKPGVLGWKDGKFVTVSEDIALKDGGGEFIENLNPGCIYYMHPEGDYRKERVVDENIRYCFFEWNYVSNVDSILNEVSVRVIRDRLGGALAEEFHPDDIDLVTYLPRCPKAAARKYAEKVNKPFESIFYKPRSERAFMGSTLEERANSINENLFLLPSMKERLKNKVVVVVDDSTVRGNNLKREWALLYEEIGVKKVYHINYTPPIGIIGSDKIARGCMFGVDMTPDDDFIARGRTLEQISEEVKMPVAYLSLEGMLRVYEELGIKKEDLCHYCVGGKHPFKGI